MENLFGYEQNFLERNMFLLLFRYKSQSLGKSSAIVIKHAIVMYHWLYGYSFTEHLFGYEQKFLELMCSSCYLIVKANF